MFVGQQSIKLYYYEADIDIANRHRPTWDDQTYRLLDVVAARQLFTDDDDVFINRETVSVTVNSRGVYLALRDQGSCTTLISLAVYYYRCPAVVLSLTRFNATAAGPLLTDIRPVNGTCVTHAVSTTSATYLCTSTGSWYLYTPTGSSQCRCEAGYQPNRQLTQCFATAPGQCDCSRAFLNASVPL